MKMEEIVGLLMQQADKYAVESIETVPTEDGGTEQKKCRKISVTIPLIVEFCRENGLPLPDELLNMGIEEEGDSIV